LAVEFSIIIPSYNRIATLGRAIESILNQTYAAKEIIVVDDGSDDQTGQLIKKYPQVNYYYQNNKGVSAARNKGAFLAKYDWLIFLDSDDALLANALEVFRSAIESQPNNKVFHGRYSLVTDRFPISKKDLKDNSSFVSGSFAIDLFLFKSLKGYDERLKFAENTELAFRLEQKSISIINIKSKVLLYHQNPAGGSKNLQNMVDSILIILKKHDSYLSNHVKHLYHQIAGVNLMRFQNYPIARTHLWKAWIFKPYKLATLGRLGIAFFPPLAKNLYKPEVSK